MVGSRVLLCVLLAVLVVEAVLSEAVHRRPVRRRKPLEVGGQEDPSQLEAEHRSLNQNHHSHQPRKFVVRRKFKTTGQEEEAQLLAAEKILPVSLPVQLASPVEDTTTQPPVTETAVEVNNKPDLAKRFLSLFTVVSFKNDACVTNTGGNNGTCYSSSDCANLGGTASGTCASGFGVCCIFVATCGGNTNINGTYFQNSGYPSSYDNVGSCQLTINKCKDSVCQLRLDFQTMSLAQPETVDNKCQSDQFIVSGGVPVPAICGDNAGAHMYVDMGLSSNSPVVLTVVTSGNSYPRSFSIKITQIECTSLSRASEGCLQYFTGVQGQVFSYNFNNGNGLQISNQDYTACIRPERSFCGIQYTTCSSSNSSFSITGATNNRLGSIVGTACSTDWVNIPCATNTNDPTTQTGSPVVCVDRMCGQVFNSVTTPNTSPNVPVYSFSKPFNIYVHTDSLEGSSSPAESGNRGFCLNFVQQPCSSKNGR